MDRKISKSSAGAPAMYNSKLSSMVKELPSAKLGIKKRPRKESPESVKLFVKV